MEFLRYTSLKRYGNVEVEGINLGKVYVFPRIDGTNTSVWTDNNLNLMAGSRNRKLSLDNDNAGFLNWLTGWDADQPVAIKALLSENTHLRLFGEWLVPHTIKDYLEDSWRTFNVFDVYDHHSERYLSYDEYKPILDYFGVNYIPCQKVIINGDYKDFVLQAELSDYLLPSGSKGEGVVLKNYEFVNRYGRMAFAKIVNSEFKASHRKEMGAPIQEKRMTEQALSEYFPKEIAEKTLAKISLEMNGWNKKYIPRLLEQSFYDFFHEELWTAIKKEKAKNIEINALRSFINQKIKEALPQIFNL